MSETKNYSISVKDLASQVHAAGDLGGKTSSKISAIEGVKLHKLFQAEENVLASELPVSGSYVQDEYTINILGRADALREVDGHLVLEEIKSTRQSFDNLKTARKDHLAQARLYTYLYNQSAPRPIDEIWVTYGDLSSGHRINFKEEALALELEAFFTHSLRAFVRQLILEAEWKEKRNKSLFKTDFPYPLNREGQKMMLDAVSRQVDSEEHIMIEAPTGIGKTMAALFPSLRAVSEEKADKIFFLSARNTGKQAAEKALHDLRAAGAHVRSVTITAKDKFRCDPEIPCDAEFCPNAVGYYERLPDALTDILQHEEAYEPATIRTYAEKHKICPFEFSLDISLFSDVVICDYNYVFDPRVRLKRFFDELSEEFIFLVDETHNLVDRGRGMFSATIFKQTVLDLKNLVLDSNPSLSGKFHSINQSMLHLRKMLKETDAEALVLDSLPEELLEALEGIQGSLENWLSNPDCQEGREELLNFSFEIATFLQAAEFFGEDFKFIYEKQNNYERAKIYCLDPSRLLKQGFDMGRAAILFSATITPEMYYKRMIFGQETPELISLPSPFPPENLSIHQRSISTKYRDRAESYTPIAEKIAGFTNHFKGNTLVFFPSFAYLDEVRSEMKRLFPGRDAVYQEQGSSDEERAAFLENFKGENLLAFAVMGGVFGEAIDLPGELLSNVVIIGPALPSVTLETKMLQEYFDALELDGFDYAFTYPGLGRVLQAVGRLIRTETDTGHALLIDPRFAYGKYKQLYPSYWQVRYQ